MAVGIIEEQVPLIRSAYQKMKERVAAARALHGRPLTYAEKILYSHADGLKQKPERGSAYVQFRPDRVAMQDATAQMALLQFMQAGRTKVAVPSTVHCDHLIRARVGASEDLNAAMSSNREVYDFLESASRKYGIGFWKPGSGIIHQVVLENYAFPGGMMIGTDSHTPNAGGLGMIAIGVGGADAAEVMAGLPWSVRWPKLVGVVLTGKLSGWTAPKDIILRVAEILTVKGGTGRIVEYIGPGARTFSATGKGTITNMGAEIGATTSLFPFDEKSAVYLEKTERGQLAAMAREMAEHLQPDPQCEADPKSFYDEVIEIDLDKLEPHVVGPHTPDLGREVSALPTELAAKGWPAKISAALIGSCTNSSYEDIGRAAHVARQALAAGKKAVVPFLVTPGSDQVFATVERDGFLEPLRAIGATVLANACGPCIGQWQRDDVPSGTPNSIITSFNRNFPKRNDGNPGTHAFIASPEVVTAFALTGTLASNPMNGLSAPSADELPARGFEDRREGFIAPPADGSAISVVVAPTSERLQILAPFAPWDGADFENCAVLLKAVGKCTTDHISPAGPWLKYRGHLDKISDNMFLGAVNAFAPEPGQGLNVLTGTIEILSAIARHYKQAGLGWVAIGDENYGEGSSREHAAMSPRLLGCKAVIVRSFARIHETNLKKQGIVPLTFVNPADWEKIGPKDRIAVRGLKQLAPGSKVTLLVSHDAGGSSEIPCQHSFTVEELLWFKAGSAMNTMRG
jgi:aconitate hydratase